MAVCLDMRLGPGYERVYTPNQGWKGGAYGLTLFKLEIADHSNYKVFPKEEKR
jgi:hypothetical protein